MQKSNKDSINFGRICLGYIDKFEEIVIFTTGFFILLVMFIQVLLRYIFLSPLFGLEEIALLIISWFYFFGAAYSVRNESYIQANIISLIVKSHRIRKRFNIASLVFSLTATLLLFFYGLKYAIWSNVNNVVTPHFLINVNYGFCALVVGSLLMSLHFVQLIQREIKRKI